MSDTEDPKATQPRLPADFDLDAPGARRRANRRLLWRDHGFIRTVWSNFFEVAPGVYRANQPDQSRVAAYEALGIRTILNLRGAAPNPYFSLEREACERLGITLVNLPGLSARSAPKREALVRLIDTLRSTEKPFLFHCKSGADRTSLAAAIYKLAVEDADIATARAQFSLRYIHVRWSKTGVLDHVIDCYAVAHDATGIDFDTWARTEYDGAEVQASFDRGERFRRAGL